MEKNSLIKIFLVLFYLFSIIAFSYTSIIALYKSYLVTDFIEQNNEVLYTKTQKQAELIRAVIQKELQQIQYLTNIILIHLQIKNADQEILQDHQDLKFFKEKAAILKFQTMKEQNDFCIFGNFKDCLNQEKIQVLKESLSQEHLEYLQQYSENEISIYQNYYQLYDENNTRLYDEEIFIQNFNVQRFQENCYVINQILTKYMSQISVDKLSLVSVFFIEFYFDNITSVQQLPFYKILYSFPSRQLLTEKYINLEQFLQNYQSLKIVEDKFIMCIQINSSLKLIFVFQLDNIIQNFFKNQSMVKWKFEIQKQNTQNLSIDIFNNKVQEQLIEEKIMSDDNKTFNQLSYYNFYVNQKGCIDRVQYIYILILLFSTFN